MKKIIWAGLVAAIATTPAFATSGFYVGGGAGYEAMKVNSKETGTYTTSPTSWSATINSSGDGPFANILTGYGWEFQNNTYLAAEIEGQYADAKATYKNDSGSPTRSSNNTFTEGGGAHIHILPGYWFNQNGMIYLLAGYGADQFQEKGKFSDGYYTDLTTTTKSTKFLGGYDMGLGLQANISTSFALRLQGSYTIYSGSGIKITQHSGGSTLTRTLKPQVMQAGLDLVYTFGAEDDDNGLLLD